MAEYRVEVHGSVGGNLVVGDHNIVVNAQTGSSVRILQEAERPAPTRRPAVRVLPRRPVAPVGRDGELGTVTAAVIARSTLQVYGASGVGKSTLLRAAAHDVVDETDGVVFVSVAGRDHGDVPQELFEACYETHGYRPSPTDLARLMSGVRVTAFVDDLECTPDELAALLDTVPDTTLVFSATERELWGTGTAFELTGLTEAAALALVQRECGRPLTPAESAAVLSTRSAGGGSPMSILRFAATLAASVKATGVARVPEQGGPVDAGGSAVDRAAEEAAAAGGRGGGADDVVPGTHGAAGDVVARVVETLSPREADLYSLMRAVGRARVTTPVLAELAESADESRVIRAAARLAAVGLADEFDDEADGRSGGASPLAVDEGGEAGLAGAGDPRAFQVADDIAVAAGPWSYRRDIREVIASMIGWVTAAGRAPVDVAAHAPLIVSLVGASIASGVPDAGSRLARISAAPIAMSLRWGAWRDVLDAGQDAARAAADEEAFAYFTHERGIRLLALGQAAAAAALLTVAAGLWQALGLSHSAALATAAHQLAGGAAGAVPPPIHSGGAGAGHQGTPGHDGGAGHPAAGHGGAGQAAPAQGAGSAPNASGHGTVPSNHPSPLAPTSPPPTSPPPPPPIPKPFPVLAVVLSVVIALVVAGGVAVALTTGNKKTNPSATPSTPAATSPTATPTLTPSTPPAVPTPTAFALVAAPDHPPALVLDANPATVWVTPPFQDPKSPDAWIAIDLGADFACTGITATPARGGTYFPSDYRIQTSDDDITWTDVPNQVYGPDNARQPVDGVLTYAFDSPVTARYVRILADVMTGTRTEVAVGGFRMALAEMSVQTS